MAVSDCGPRIRVDADHVGEVCLLRVTGVLDGVTYRALRDAVIKAALDEPRAVVVDVDDLSVPAESAWSVFTSARWHVNIWPDVPILLVSAHPERRRAIWHSGVSRYVPVHASRDSTVGFIADRSVEGRRRARIQLPAGKVAIDMSRTAVSDWLTAWAREDLIPAAGAVATIFIENVLAHTDSAPVLIVESYRETVTVAVEDGSSMPAGVHEDAERGAEIVSGLAIVAALCRAWGSTPTPSGKTVWALVGRENRL